MHRVSIAFLMSLVISAGCSESIWLEDNAPLGMVRSLHSPYVEGSSMVVSFVHQNEKVDLSGWRLMSSAPEVFEIGPSQKLTYTSGAEGRVWATGRAARPGTAELMALDAQGSVVVRSSVEVRRPDEIRVLAQGPARMARVGLLGAFEEQGRVQELRIVKGGTAKYEARYYAGGARLYGLGALSAEGSSNVSAIVRPDLYDRLEATATTAGPATLGLSINGTPFGSMPVMGVDPGQIASLRVSAQDETEQRQNKMLGVLVQASDASGATVYGLSYQWQLSAKAQTTMDEVYSYPYAPDVPQTLSVQANGKSAQVAIHAPANWTGEYYPMGCSTISAYTSPPSPGAFALAGLFLIGLVRRRLTTPLHVGRGRWQRAACLR